MAMMAGTAYWKSSRDTLRVPSSVGTYCGIIGHKDSVNRAKCQIYWGISEVQPVFTSSIALAFPPQLPCVSEIKMSLAEPQRYVRAEINMSNHFVFR